MVQEIERETSVSTDQLHPECESRVGHVLSSSGAVTRWSDFLLGFLSRFVFSRFLCNPAEKQRNTQTSAQG